MQVNAAVDVYERKKDRINNEPPEYRANLVGWSRGEILVCKANGDVESVAPELVSFVVPDE